VPNDRFCTTCGTPLHATRRCDKCNPPRLQPRDRIALMLAAGFVLVVVLSSIFNRSGREAPTENPPTSAVPQTTEARVLPYKIVRVRDISIGAIRRLDVRVVLPTHYQQAQAMSIAQAVVTVETHSQAVNAISIFFYGPDTDPNGPYDVASVDWAPNGRWADATSVETGDYRTFRYTMTYLPPRPPTPPSNLALSPKKGLLRSPLPRGAVLVEKFRGDPSAARDPYEKYRIHASAAQIRAFYEHEMPPAGWKKWGPSIENILIYRKARLEIGVLIRGKGGAFTLMGS
jgi:hypothetical protein